ncbi:MAG: mechanosensitive ion channel [Thermoleophilia bacterium]|nr:mechanosensitive ion channel [Thermoleophilia bacterium]
MLDVTLISTTNMRVTIGGVLGGVLALIAVTALSWLLRRQVMRVGERNPSMSRSSLYTLTRVLHYTLLTFGVLWAIDIAGIALREFGLFAGALGVGLGFGLQAIFSNFISGLILLFDRSLKVGDFVDLPSGASGEVRDIRIRATRITTNDNVDILVPNSEFINGNVINWTHRDDSRRLHVPFGVAYGTDKELVKRAALEAADSQPFTTRDHHDRQPQVWLVEFGESSLNFELVVWLTAAATKRPVAVQAAYTWALHTALESHGIEIPFPQRDLHVRTVTPAAAEALPAAAEAQSPARPSAVPAAPSHNDAQADAERSIARDDPDGEGVQEGA